MQKWKYIYGDYNIEVKNSISKCELYINDKKIDENNSPLGASLTGNLDNGEQVLATLHSGAFSVNCDLYIVKEKLKEISSN